MPRAVLLRTLVLLLGLFGPSAALSHAMLNGSMPVEGQVFDTAPGSFVLRFREAVDGLFFRLVSPDDTVTELRPSDRGDGILEVAAPPGLSDGTHLLVWRVVGSDGHPSGGVVTFGIGGMTETPALPDFRPQLLSAAIWATDVLLYLCLAIGVGGFAFRAWLIDLEPLPAIAARAVTVSLALVIVLAPAGVSLNGLDALGASWDVLAGTEAWRAGSRLPFAAVGLLACAASLVALAGARMKSLRAARVASLLALVASGAAVAATGHVGTGDIMSTASRLLLVVHAVCVILWVGALVPLGAMFWHDRADAAKALARFSKAIPVPLAALVVSGLALSILRLQSAGDLVFTQYGLILSAKIALVTTLLLLAAYNRYRLTPRIGVQPSVAGRTLTRSIGLELALVVLIVGTLGLWRFVPPAGAFEERDRSTVALLSERGVSALLSITPVDGLVRTININLSHDGLPVDADEVRVTATHVSNIMEPVRRLAAQAKRGAWSVDRMLMPYDGIWSLEIDVVSGSGTVRLTEDVLLSG